MGSVAGFWVLFFRLKKYHGLSEMTFQKVAYFSILVSAWFSENGITYGQIKTTG